MTLQSRCCCLSPAGPTQIFERQLSSEQDPSEFVSFLVLALFFGRTRAGRVGLPHRRGASKAVLGGAGDRRLLISARPTAEEALAQPAAIA